MIQAAEIVIELIKRSVLIFTAISLYLPLVLLNGTHEETLGANNYHLELNL